MSAGNSEGVLPEAAKPAQRYLVPEGTKRFDPRQWPTAPPPDGPRHNELRKLRRRSVRDISRLQRLLYAENRYALLLLFQAMDAAGKDSTINALLTGVNPAGCQVFNFKQPSSEELDHDFLWRTARSLPERGRIGVFNRSYYEEVLVVRVHPELLQKQNLPHLDPNGLWQQRMESIVEHERHLARNGTVILKFFLNISRDEQKARFLRRLDRPDKHWKFAISDVRERGFWNEYMSAYGEAIRSTARSHAPWYAIPADSKPYMRWAVADIVRDTLASLDLHNPEPSLADLAMFDDMRRQLENE
ncbi:MAG: polyphosphate kinase 2 family protein [Acidobacteriota bacterium]|nr:polyphosphate kinase 2 family protein [Acidobacteriota bacterium]MDE2924249.1 polyphosphate kinase 2 family protein [Acidobacteriota bacterium]MDE3263899.1 polyphosphate kinase 2 family protein [Acidobacteriota bacterium]